MALPAVNEAFYPTPDEVLNQILADLRFGYARRGITANVEPGSELHERALAVANRVSIAIQNNQIALADVSPLDAVEDALEELAGVFGVTRRPAASAAGLILARGTGVVTLPEAFQCTSPAGIQYQVPVAVTVTLTSNGVPVLVRAVAAGDDTDAAAGVILTWDSAAIGGLLQTCAVGPGGIDGGRDADDDEVLRARLLDRLSFPGVGGNWSQLKKIAEEATGAVEAAFVYPAARGPASTDVAVTEEGGDRTLAAEHVNVVANAVIAEMPGHTSFNVTTVFEQRVDIIVNLTLPLPIHGGGAGGGWRDATPWPSTAETGVNVFAEITAVDPANRQITVNSTAPDTPVANEHFGIWDPAGGADGTGAMSEYLIEAVGGAPGAFVLTVSSDSPSLSFVTAGMYCSAGATNLKTYGTDFRDAVLKLGPGEKTTSVDILPRARRRPSPEIIWPTDITSRTLEALLNKHTEILNSSYAGRFDTGTKVTRTSPGVPASTTLPPRILTLRHLSFRRQVT